MYWIVLEEDLCPCKGLYALFFFRMSCVARIAPAREGVELYAINGGRLDARPMALHVEGEEEKKSERERGIV